jgi:hypothetical protein
MYLFSFLLRPALLLGHFALFLFARVACDVPICGTTCVYSSSISSCVVNSGVPIISFNVETYFQLRPLQLSDRDEVSRVSFKAWRLTSIWHCVTFDAVSSKSPPCKCTALSSVPVVSPAPTGLLGLVILMTGSVYSYWLGKGPSTAGRVRNGCRSRSAEVSHLEAFAAYREREAWLSGNLASVREDFVPGFRHVSSRRDWS